MKHDKIIARSTKARGFTLLEILIVIAIIAILAAFLIWVLNPAEILRRGRDSQRLSDLKTLNQALAYYLTVVSNPSLDGRMDNWCEDSKTWDPFPDPGGKIWLSLIKDGWLYWNPPGSHPDPKGNWDDSYSMGDPYPLWAVSSGNPRNIDGTGWIFINFTTISGGSPISTLPVDPINDVDPSGTAVENDDFLYRYTCKETETPGGWKCGALTWEIDAQLESQEYQEKKTTDGGDHVNMYEVGTCLYLLPDDTGNPRF